MERKAKAEVQDKAKIYTRVEFEGLRLLAFRAAERAGLRYTANLLGFCSGDGSIIETKNWAKIKIENLQENVASHI